MIDETKIRESFSVQAHWCAKLGSHFTAQLLSGLGETIDRTTATGRTLLDWQGNPDAMGDAIALRLAGALHGLVREGRLPALAKLYPPHSLPSKDVLIDAALEAIGDADIEICERLVFAPQTNEVARASILFAGMRVIAGETNLPLSLFELGASAGLNLMMDKFGYTLGGDNFGIDRSSIQLCPEWLGPPPIGSEPTIIGRRGCDLNPLDVTNPAHRARLIAYVWPDQLERLARVTAAIEIAQADPPKLDKADAAAWVEEQFVPSPQMANAKGVTRVLFHSIAYQYFPEDVKRRIEKRMEAAGMAATADTPLAWLAFEQIDSLGPTLTLRLWRGSPRDGETRILAKSKNAHVHGIDWFG